jgi:hypothetical protein
MEMTEEEKEAAIAELEEMIKERVAKFGLMPNHGEFMSIFLLGRINFETYSKKRSGVAVGGERIPKWEELKPEIREAWIEAAREVADKVAEWNSMNDAP